MVSVGFRRPRCAHAGEVLLWFRALRAPFLAASVLPFLAGVLLVPEGQGVAVVLLGLSVVAATHLGANLVNDLSDTRAGVDTQNETPYGFFGGSKLIHTGRLSARVFLVSACAFAALALLSVAALASLTGRLDVVAIATGVVAVAWAYSSPPFRLSYRCLGEPTVFVLFGPAVVMGGQSLQTGTMPTAESGLLAVPFGLLTTALLFLNEVPDAAEDARAGKRTWVHLTGVRNAHQLFGILAALAFASIAVLIAVQVLTPFSLLALAGLIPAAEAKRIIRHHPASKKHCVQAAKLMLAAHLVASLCIVMDLAL